MDTIDYQIVEFLTQDARMPFTQIANKIGRSTATVHQRVHRLREQGIIKSFTAELDWEALGYSLDAFVSIRDTESQGLEQLARNIRAIPFVMSVAAVTGEFDLLLHIRARSSTHLGEILDEIRRISPGPTRTLVTLTNYVSGQTPPLPAE